MSDKLIGVLLVVAIVAVLCAIFVPRFIETPSIKPPGVRSDLRSVVTALAAYAVDNGCYPPHVLGSDPAAATAHHEGLAHQTFLRTSPGGISTPIAYVTSHFTDIWAPEPGTGFIYWTDGERFILFSTGRDQDYDINPEQDWNSSVDTADQPGETLIQLTYDPSNGTRSNGDIWRMSFARASDVRSAHSDRRRN